MPILAALATLAAVMLIFAVLWDAFETIILPRRVRRQVRLTLIVYKLTWGPWSAIARRIRNGGVRESFLSVFGPIALIFLLVVWAIALILGFGLLQWALESPLIAPEQRPGFGDRKSTRLNSSHVEISYAVFCLKKKKELDCSGIAR